MVTQWVRFAAGESGALGRKGLIVLALAMIAVGALAVWQWSHQLGADLPGILGPSR